MRSKCEKLQKKLLESDSKSQIELKLQKQGLLNVPMLHTIESFVDIEKKTRSLHYQNSLKTLEAKFGQIEKINIKLQEDIQKLMNKAL